MKLLLVIVMLCATFGYAAPLTRNPINGKEKGNKDEKKEKKENTLVSRNFHSIKKWKITVKYTNEDVISKTIEINDNNVSSSAMEIAFADTEKYIKTLKKVKSYTVSPVSDNSFVLLAGGK